MFDKSHCQVERARKLFPDFFEPKILQKDVLKEDIMDFDVCVGNPPYQQDDDGHGASSVPIYNHFVRFANKISNKRSLVIPAKWFSGGKGLESFRDWMLNRNDIIEIEHHENAKKFFDIKLKGGVCIVHSDDDYNGPTHYNGREIDTSKYDVLVTKKRAYPIIDSVLENSDKFLSDIYYSGSFSGFTTNDDRFENKKVNGHYMKCYVSKSQGREVWVKKSDTKNQGGGFWKVIVPYGSREPWNGGFENPRIAAPDETYSRTYVSFRVDSKEQAQNLISYLNTEFAAFMLNLRKIAHHINEDNVKWVPLPPLDEEWTDKKLKNRNFFDLSEDDWNYIQSFNLT
jgi:site-specific DNA-methyltransferase (adenine-specific)